MSITIEEVSALRQGDYVIHENRPLKITKLSKSKTGKHGRAKAHITASDIFNNKKHVFIESTGDKIDVPCIVTKKYKIMTLEETDDIDIYEVFMVDEDGNTITVKISDTDMIDKITKNDDLEATTISFGDEIKIVNVS
uniref:Translation initiation factor 5A-like N-terminal domain-containing protein n=1 Tax=viral metagenome TaxID=1070528 RepID=A0A6C0EDD1_9ZZZZ